MKVFGLNAIMQSSEVMIDGLEEDVDDVMKMDAMFFFCVTYLMRKQNNQNTATQIILGFKAHLGFLGGIML